MSIDIYNGKKKKLLEAKKQSYQKISKASFERHTTAAATLVYETTQTVFGQILHK